jgi:hypothetical protein
MVVTHQEKENFYIVMECDAIYIGRTFNLWLLLVTRPINTRRIITRRIITRHINSGGGGSDDGGGGDGLYV